MHKQYLKPAFEIREANLYLTIKSACPHQGIIQYLLSIRCSHYNNATISTKAIHLHEQLVKSTLSLVIGPELVLPFLTHCVKFVDKDNRGCLLFGLME